MFKKNKSKKKFFCNILIFLNFKLVNDNMEYTIILEILILNIFILTSVQKFNLFII